MPLSVLYLCREGGNNPEVGADNDIRRVFDPRDKQDRFFPASCGTTAPGRARPRPLHRLATADPPFVSSPSASRLGLKLPEKSQRLHYIL